MNGLEGTLRQYDAHSDRWVVHFDDGQERALRPENLELLASQGGAPTGSAGSAEESSEDEDEEEEEEEVEEVRTEGALAAQAGGPSMEGQDAGAQRALLEIFAPLGMQDLDVRNCGGGAWMIEGIPVRLHFDESGVALLAAKRLRASTDGGRTWDLFVNVFQRHLAQASGGPTAPSPGHGPGPSRQPPASTRAPGTAGAFRAAAAPPQSQQARYARDPHQQHHQHPHGAEAPRGASHDGVVLPGGGDERLDANGALPRYRSDGLPAFNQAFPSSFDARAGQTNYYSSFRVRVPPKSQYESGA